MNRIIFCVFLFSISTLFSQNKNSNSIELLIKDGDSLTSINKKHEALMAFRRALVISLDSKNKEMTAFIYKKIGVIHYKKKEYLKAENHYKKGLLIDSLTKTAANNYYNISLVKKKLNQQDSVLHYLEKSLNIYKTLSYDEATYNAFLSAGITYKNRQLYEKALELLIIAHNGLKTGNKIKLARTCTVIGNIHNQIKNYNQSLAYYKEALHASKTSNKKEKSLIYNNIAIAYKHLKVHDSVIINYKKALLLTTPEDPNYGIILQNLALTHSASGNMKIAKKNFKQAIELHKISKDTSSLLYCYNGMASLLIKQNRKKDVKPYLDSVSFLLPRSIDKTPLLDYYTNQVDYQTSIKKYKTALNYYKKYNELFEKTYNIKQVEIIQNMQSRFDYEKKEHTILKLSTQNKDNLLKIASKNRRLEGKNLIIISLSCIIVLGFIGYYIYVQRQKATKQRLKIEKLEAIYQGQETIQKRIAQDLHDVITNNFDGLRLQILALLRMPNPKDHILVIANELQDINQQIRLVSHRLSPINMHIKHHKFTEIIKARLSEFQVYHKIYVNIKNELPELLNDLHIETQNNFYGILLEVLNNSSKHAQATELSITNHINKNQSIHFILTDNGIGISNNYKMGIGLLNIKQRSEIIGGSAIIKRVDSGTEVHIKFPLQINLK